MTVQEQAEADRQAAELERQTAEAVRQAAYKAVVAQEVAKNEAEFTGTSVSTAEAGITGFLTGQMITGIPNWAALAVLGGLLWFMSGGSAARGRR